MSQLLAKIKNLTQSKFIRSVILVAGGAAGAQAITMAFAPIITRMYGPESFGLLGAFMATLGIVTPIAALAYPIAIVLPKSDDDAKGIAKLSVRIALVIALAFSLILLVAGEQIAAVLGMQAIAGFMLLIPLAMFFSALQQVMQQWLIRKKQFKVMARIAVSQSFILNGSKIGVGWFWPIGPVLIILATLGNMLYAVQLWFGAKKWADSAGRIDTPAAGEVDLKALAYKHRDFPYYRAPQIFINALSQSLPVLMLASFFGPASAGFYAIGRTVMGMPSALVGNAVGDVFYPRINEAAQSRQNIFKLILKATLLLGLVGIIPFGLVVVFGPWLFSLVFGQDWAMAGEYARWLSVWMFFMFMNNPSNKAIPVLGIQRFYLFFSTVTIVVRLIALAVGFLIFSSDIVAIALFSVSGAIINISLIVIVLFASIKHQRNYHVS